jgi:hypothetical protein
MARRQATGRALGQHRGGCVPPRVVRPTIDQLTRTPAVVRRRRSFRWVRDAAGRAARIVRSGRCRHPARRHAPQIPQNGPRQAGTTADTRVPRAHAS